ncbi:uncharacterized protein LOC125503403 [Dendroctonus ponderosae]|uniref:uncharacterized protein LOC125503403 n=1 Tax=Dendroctonus ponderosae TaxID=77166 RepID=UPI002035AD20|nr:uncharacterized protein LOC125503403 [Dendroctonus ponderosae]
MCKLLGIHKTRTTPLHPESDGMVERFNRTIDNYLRIVVNNKQDNWDTQLAPFLLAYRSAVHESTGKSPAEILFGRELRLPIDLLTGRPEDLQIGEDYGLKLAEQLKLVHDEVRTKLKIESDRMKSRYDARPNHVGFSEGERVWFFNPRRTKGRCPKLQNSWEGPYTIITRLNDVTYRIQKSPQAEFKVVHIHRLARYNDDPGVT